MYHNANVCVLLVQVASYTRTYYQVLRVCTMWVAGEGPTVEWSYLTRKIVREKRQSFRGHGDFIKSWKTSAVSTTVWMVETQLCKLRGDLYIFVQKEIISYCTKKVVACLVDLMRVGIGENTFPSHELVVSRVTHHRQPCSVLCAGPGYYVPGASSALRKINISLICYRRQSQKVTFGNSC